MGLTHNALKHMLEEELLGEELEEDELPPELGLDEEEDA
jgi:hypothetical protein